MVPCGPRIDLRLVAALERLDDPTVRMAETYRRLGAVARELGLVPPSYAQVRTLVHGGRRPSTSDVLLDIAFLVRSPEALGDDLAGTLP